MAITPKKPKPNDNSVKCMLGALLLSKSLILMEYNNKRDILNAKYYNSKVSQEVYHFCKYCVNNPSDISYFNESGNLRYQNPVFEFYIEHYDMGFKYSSQSDVVYFKVQNNWMEFSTNKYDKMLLSSVFFCLSERERNEKILSNIQNTIDSKLRYLAMYKETK